MNKPGALRDAIRTALVAKGHDVAVNPDRMAVLVQEGTVHSMLTEGLAFQYAYTVELILLDFPGHPDEVMAPLLLWLAWRSRLGLLALTLVGVVARGMIDPLHGRSYRWVYSDRLWLDVWGVWDTGWFLQIVAGHRGDLAVPGAPYSFGELIDAQALGDARSLVDHGLPVLRVHLGDDVEAGLQALKGLVRRAIAVR